MEIGVEIDLSPMLTDPEMFVGHALQFALEIIRPKVLESIRRECPKDKGDLAASFEAYPAELVSPTRAEFIVASSGEATQYLRAVIHGVQPPVAGTLVKAEDVSDKKAFKAGGIFFKSFVIPGRPPNPFIDRAVEKDSEEWIALATENFVYRIERI